MSRFWILCALVSGCIYTDPINQRPSIGIKRKAPTGEVFRGSAVTLEANYHDPEGQIVFFQWRAYACTDATPDASGARPGCDATPFFTGVLETADFDVPSRRADADVPVAQVIALLQAQDDYGATSKPTQELLLPISNAVPKVVLRKDSRYNYVKGTDIRIYAAISDIDDGPLAPTLEWKVFSPQSQPTFAFEDLVPPVPQDPMHPEIRQLGKRFHPDAIGDYEIQLDATDPLGGTFMDHLTISVVDDTPPCLRQLAPIVAPPGTALPLTEPTLFRVDIVEDDLDPFPATSDPVLGTPHFFWSILPPGASTRQSLSATGNAVPLDPTNYQPGDIVELRVEIGDRNTFANRPLGCAESAATCAIGTDTTCLQRQTWRVEVR